MKALKLFSLLMIVGLITMSMGFPVDMTSAKNKRAKNPAYTYANRKAVMKGKEPIRQLNMHMFTNTAAITVKVFDVKGVLIMKEEVTMEEFLSKSKKATLPAGSTFVMFHQNTAYFFMETSLVH